MQYLHQKNDLYKLLVYTTYKKLKCVEDYKFSFSIIATADESLQFVDTIIARLYSTVDDLTNDTIKIPMLEDIEHLKIRDSDFVTLVKDTTLETQ